MYEPLKIERVVSVSHTDMPDCLVVIIVFAGEDEECIHYLRDGDEYGNSPYLRKWIADNNPFILPYEPSSLTSDELRASMPQLSMVDFRRKLRGIKVVERDGEEELDGIYEEDILEKIALIADKELQAEARDYFMYAQYIERINPWVEILGGMFGITPEEIDAFWLG